MSLGLYLHVPFCRRICPYCAFNVVRARGHLPAEQLLLAMAAEARQHAALFRGPVRTVYFGGGTPSLMTPQWIEQTLDAVLAPFARAPQLEVTVEVEPETMDEGALRSLRTAGVTRLSIGWQSSTPRVLQALGRGHDALAASRLVASARRAGFDNINLDWMLAAPGQTDEEFAQDAAAIVALRPAHVSCYVLTLEPKTPFARQHAKGTLTLPGEDCEARWLDLAARALERAGLRRYEVASFARPGRQSRHNRAYWTGRPYLGIGPGAHSFTRDQWRQGRRWMGHKSLARYLAHWQAKSVKQVKQAPVGTDFLETLTCAQLALERVIVGLRRVSGISLQEPVLRPFAPAVDRLADALEKRNWARRYRGRLLPTRLGLMHADAAAAFFVAQDITHE